MSEYITPIGDDKEDNSDKKLEITRRYKLTADILQNEFDNEMRWINDIERKASTLLGLIGVILTLSVPLVVYFSTQIGDKVTNNLINFAPNALLLSMFFCIFIFEEVCMLLALIWSYKVSRVTTFIVPNYSSLAIDVLNGDGISEENLQHKRALELDNSIKALNEVRDRKAKNLKLSQKVFMFGGIALVILIALGLILAICP